MTAGAIVSRFIANIEALDVDAAVGLLAEDVLYDNVPMPDIVGRNAVRATLSRFMGSATRVEWRVLHQLDNGTTVMNERIDIFEYPTHRIELPVAGMFQVSGGLITLWRDYFDLASYRRQFPS